MIGNEEQTLVLRWMLLPFVGVLGAITGSFLNAFIYRWPMRISLWKRARSFCPACKHQLAWYDNIPLVSYLLLLGRCRYCRTPIHWRYPVVELITTGLFLLVYYQEMILNFGRVAPRGGPVFTWPVTAVHLVFIAALIGASFIDCIVMRLPNEITVGGAMLAPFLSVIVPRLHLEAPDLSGIWRLDALFSSLLGMIAGAAILWLIGLAGEAVLKKQAMGFGDVKLMALVGGLLGWLPALMTIVMGAMIGAAVGGINLALTGKHKVPFGPFLVAGCIVTMVWGPWLLNLYLGFIQGYEPALPYLVPLPW